MVPLYKRGKEKYEELGARWWMLISYNSMKSSTLILIGWLHRLAEEMLLYAELLGTRKEITDAYGRYIQRISLRQLWQRLYLKIKS